MVVFNVWSSQTRGTSYWLLGTWLVYSLTYINLSISINIRLNLIISILHINRKNSTPLSWNMPRTRSINTQGIPNFLLHNQRSISLLGLIANSINNRRHSLQRYISSISRWRCCIFRISKFPHIMSIINRIFLIYLRVNFSLRIRYNTWCLAISLVVLVLIMIVSMCSMMMMCMRCFAWYTTIWILEFGWWVN